MNQVRTIKKACYTPQEVSFIYGLSVGTLANWRTKKIGPRYYKVNGRKVLYFLHDLENWSKANPVQTIDSV